MKKLFLLFVSLSFLSCMNDEPAGFKYIKTEIPDVQIEARYFSINNFIGTRIDGYESENLMLTEEAISALKKVQAELKLQNLRLKIFDAYRPQRAVDHFVRWCADENDTVNKARFYPTLNKNQLLPQGYLAAKSGHSRGSTLDLTIVDDATGYELDMGTAWDFFGEQSNGDFAGITALQKENRELLNRLMTKHGFKRPPEEWWHFTLINEPYPDTYFDFVID